MTTTSPYWRLVLTSIVHAFIGSSAFYHTNSLNQIEVFVKNFTRESFQSHYDIELEEATIAWIWAILSTSTGIGAALFGCLATYPMKRFGVRNTVMKLKNLVEIIAACLQFTAVKVGSVELLLVGRLIAGYGVILAMHIPVFLAECSPDEHRGMVAVIGTLGWPFFTNVAAIMGLRQVLGRSECWEYVLLVPAFFALVHMALTPFFPSSPKYLFIIRQKTDSADKAIRKYHGPKAETKEIFREYSDESEVGSTETKTVGYKKILTTKHLAWPFWLCISVTISASLCAHDIAQLYSTGIIEQMNVSDMMAPILTLLIVQLPSLVTQIICVVLVERCGRRRLLLFGLFLGIMANVCLFVAQLGSYTALYVTILGLVGLFLSTVGPDIGPHPIGELLPGELAPQASRPVTSSVAFGIAGWGMPVLTTLLFPPLQYYIGAFAILPLLILALCVFFFLFFFLPETRGRRVDDIVKTWMKTQYVEDSIPLSIEKNDD